MKVTVKTRLQRFKDKIKEKIGDGKAWIYDHKQECIVLIPYLVIATKSICKMIIKVAGINRKEKMMKLTVYDRSEQHHWFLRRSLSNAEWYEVNMRRHMGERLGDILEDMKLLK